MLRSMFGIGGSEILVILVIALLFLGPDKLPDAAKTISKGIRDLKKQSRALQQQIESDEKIGGAIRDLKSALRGEDEPYRPPARKKEIDAPPESAGDPTPALEAGSEHKPIEAAAAVAAADDPNLERDADSALLAFEGAHETAPARLTMPPTAGQADDVPAPSASEDAELAALVKPAPNTIARTPRPVDSDEPDRKSG